MQIKYVSEDGVEFDTAEECRTYEAGNFMKMWDIQGRRVATACSAKYAYLPTLEATKAFIRLCEEEEESYDGLTPGHTGLFVWAEEVENYVMLNPNELQRVIEEM